MTSTDFPMIYGNMGKPQKLNRTVWINISYILYKYSRPLATRIYILVWNFHYHFKRPLPAVQINSEKYKSIKM